MRGHRDPGRHGEGERDDAADAEAACDLAHREVVAASAQHRRDGTGQQQLATDEERDPDDVQEADDRPGLHQPVEAGCRAGSTRRSRRSQRPVSAVGTISPKSRAASAGV